MTRAHGRLTRRDVIGGFAAAGAGALLGPPAARAAASPQGERVFSRRVGRVSGLSEAIAPGRGFVLAGVQWSGPPGARIELRSRTGRGSWGRWGIASVRGHEPDRGVTGSALFGDGLWLGRSDAVQLRSSQPVDGVRVHFIAPQDATPAVASAAALPLATPQLPAGGGQPPIIARSAWAGSAAAPSAGPYYGSVQLAFVHHSDNPNGYSEAEVPGMILSIYDYHRYVHGWFDIGYNFVIDAFGRVWEARAGGIDEPVIGAQAGGYNEVSTGVVVLGTFMSVSPTPAAVGALERLLAWKLPLHGVPALGTVTVEVDPADAFYTPFEPGQRVPLPRIAGHRDGDTTDCPGDVLYGELASIRSAVDRTAGVPVALTLGASRLTVPPATPVVVAGTLASLDGTPLAGAPVAVQTVSGFGTATTIATATTDADGAWLAGVTLTRSEIVRALHAGAPAAVSAPVAIGLEPAITLTLASTSPLRVTGTVDPHRPTVTIDVYQLAGQHRRLVLTRVATVRAGAFTAGLSLGSRVRAGASYEIVARAAASETTVAGASAPVAVTL